MTLVDDLRRRNMSETWRQLSHPEAEDSSRSAAHPACAGLQLSSATKLIPINAYPSGGNAQFGYKPIKASAAMGPPARPASHALALTSPVLHGGPWGSLILHQRPHQRHPRRDQVARE